jgi:predicted permease
LGRAPVFTAVAVLSLGLGIGANTAMFTLVDQVLLRMLPVERPRELIQFRLEGGRVGAQSGDGRHTFAHPQYLKFRDRNGVLSGLTGVRVERAGLVGADRSERIGVALVAGNYFQVLGVKPHAGRVLTPEDDRWKNAHPVAVLQYDFWRTRYGARREAIGQDIRLNGTPFRVIGVAAAGFEGTDNGLPVNVFVPVTMKPAVTPTWDALDDERYAWFYLFGRLKPGVTREKAEAELKVLYRQMQEEELKGPMFAKFPDLRERLLKQTFTLIPAERGQSFLRETFERPLVVLQWLVAVVLAIACANVASLMLARAAARRREAAIRTALGASRGRIAGQYLVESLLVASAGGAVGLALSYGLARGLIRFLPFDPANLSLSAAPDPRILGFTAAVTLVTAVLFGLAPAVQGSKSAPAEAMKNDSGPVACGHVRMRKLLVGLQVGLCTMLMIGAGLFARSLAKLQEVDLGFKTENVVTFGVNPATVYQTPRKMQVYREVIERLAGLPGVRAAGANTSRLLTGGRWDSSVSIPGVEKTGDEYPWSFFNAVSPGYFEALRIPVKAGRDFTWADWGTEKSRCLVNESMARAYFGGGSPVGRMMAQGRGNTPDMEIIGTFGDARYHNVRGETPRQTFVSMGSARYMANVTGFNIYARTDGDPRRAMAMMRDAVRRVDPNLVVTDMRTMDEQLNNRLSNERLLSFLSAGFAGLATLLAMVGLYGVLAFVVTRRTREIGIRMAMGAEARSVVGLVLGEVAAIIGAGILAGVVCGLGAARYVESQLFGMTAWDPGVFAAGAGALLAISLAAAFVPAWRASRIDPMRALRWE